MAAARLVRGGPLLRHRDFRRLWAGEGISEMGTQVSLLAIPLVAVRSLHATTFQVGLLSASSTAAFLLVGLPAGVVVDRHRRRPMMIAADIGRVLAVGSVPVASTFGALTLIQLYCVTLATGVLSVFFDVAYQSYLPSLVGLDHVVEGNAKLAGTAEVAQIGGPSLAGGLVQAIGGPYAVAVDAASYLWSAAAVSTIRTTEQPPEVQAAQMVGDIRDGLRFVLAHPVLRAIAATTATGNLFSGVITAVEVPFLVRTVHASPGIIGALFAAAGIGGVLGAFAASPVARHLGGARSTRLGIYLTAGGLLLWEGRSAPPWACARRCGSARPDRSLPRCGCWRRPFAGAASSTRSGEGAAFPGRARDTDPMPAASYLSGPSAAPLLGDTIGANLAATAAAVAEGEALVDVASGRRYTWSEFDSAVDALASGLLGAGVAKGDRVGIWAPNSPEWVFVQYASARVGAVLVTINPAYRTSELRYALAQSGVRLLVAAPEFRGSDYRAMIAEVRPDCPGLEQVLILGSPEWEHLADHPLDRSGLDDRAAVLDPDDPINIQYTSGTTGFPKGATLSHHNILNNGHSIGVLLGYTPQDRVCVPVPFYHCFGMVIGNLACTSTGATIVIPAPAFDPSATLRSVAQERATSLYGVPTMFIAELAAPDFAQHDLTSLRTGVMAGSPCPVEVMKRVVSEMHMPEVTIMYGMTETSPVSTMTRRDDDLERRVSTVGTVFPHVEVKVIDPASGRIVPRGQVGELCTRGYSVMLGYWEDPERTAEVLDRARWMHTGDLATVDDAGYVNIVGRSKDMVIRGGENVYPREVEEFLYTHPDIVDVQVIGVPDDRYGEELMAWVRLREGATLDTEALRAWCRGKIAHFKVPRYLKLVDEFPMTVTGKVQKFKMRETAIEELGLDRP